MELYRSVAIIIPSLNPDEKLLSLLADLREAGFARLLVVNDGSSAEYDEYFEKARDNYGCTVLRHAVNQGKGRALKTAFNHLLNEDEPCLGAVTVDSDGQHRIADTIAVAKKVIDNPDALVMGCRDFSDNNPNIPARSRFGNRTTSRVLRLLCGITLSDTQTGLRGFSPQAMRRFLATKGERFEYEMNMILDAHESGIAFLEVPIETVYIEENKSSHFNPLLDSVRIYSVFLKFIAASLSSFVVDILAFTLFVATLGWLFPFVATEIRIIIATYAARVLSGLFNFTVNKKTVFKSHGNTGSRLLRYCILSVAQASLSAFATSGLYALLNWNETLLKLIVDCILFLLSFRIQRGWVFK
ncbi:MAG: bifunctional glycosyltransferase family 2/GtrA family protein [Clostridia bacterium]|nr:bifunctional glycosyltransferase family 2/GtrA family protein [Clostridia bacterium]